MKKTFLEFVQDKKKGMGEDAPIVSRVSLGEENDFPPLMISDDPNSEHYGKNKNLAPIVRAFKKGANWGWSKDEKSGEDKPVKVGGKKLFMTGGALRDHLAGKKPRNIELATNCSPDEVYHILSQNKFEFIGDGDQPPQSEGRQVFWVKTKDKKGRPYSFGVKVKGDEFDLAVFTKTSKGKDGKVLEPGTHADDAMSRDFTINSMYLLLSNDNGPNKEVHDMYGGMHHLKSGKIAAVGDLGSKLKEDPVRALRLARMMARYGDPKKMSEEEKETIRGATDGLSNLDPKDIMDEFQKGLDYDDTDTRGYLKIYNDLGLLPHIFPGMNLDTKLPKQLRELGDKHAPIAWMLRGHDPKEVETTLGGKWKPEDLKKITFLIKSLGMGDAMDPTQLDDLTKGFMGSGVSSRKLKDWLVKLGGKHEGIIDAFLQHAQGPRVKVHQSTPEGHDSVTQEFTDLVDPFTGDVKYDEAEHRKKVLEWENFRKILNYTMPKVSR